MKQVWPITVQHGVECRFNLVFTGDVLTWYAEGAGQHEEIGVIGKGGFAISFLEKQLLPLSNHP